MEDTAGCLGQAFRTGKDRAALWSAAWTHPVATTECPTRRFCAFVYMAKVRVAGSNPVVLMD